MRAFAVLAVSIVLVSFLFFPVVMAAPPMPNDVQMVEPDPSLPKEIADFWGKWEGTAPWGRVFLIVEKIDKENASVYEWRAGNAQLPESRLRYEAKVTKEYGKYKIWFRGSVGEFGSRTFEYTLKGKNLECSFGAASYKLIRVP